MNVDSKAYYELERSIRDSIMEDFNHFFDERYGYDDHKICAKIKAYKYLKERCTPINNGTSLTLFSLINLARSAYGQN